MNRLAESVLDYLWFLNFSEEHEADLQLTSEMLGNALGEIDSEYSEPEKEALMEAAKRRLATLLREPDEYGYTPRKLVTPEQKEFLEAIAAGHFLGPEIE